MQISSTSFTMLAKRSSCGGFLFFEVFYTFCKAVFGVHVLQACPVQRRSSYIYVVASFP